MVKIFNAFFSVLKYLLFLVAFGSCLYIVISMYSRLHKSMMDSIRIFLPFALLLILFMVNLIARQKGVTQNIFYNITCCVVFSFIVVASYRALFDQGMIANASFGTGINFNYYADALAPTTLMLYGLAVANICFMFMKPKEEKELEASNK